METRKILVRCLYQLFEVSLQGQHPKQTQMGQIVSATSKNKLIVANISYVIGSILISFGLSSLFAPTEQMINKHVFALAIGFFSIIYSIGWLIASDD